MDKQQNAWYDMYLDVMAICDSNEAIWEEKEFFASPYNRFVANHALIEAARVIQMTNSTGYTDAKNLKREAVVALAKQFSRAMNSYALSHPEPALKKVAHQNASEIDKMDDKTLVGFASILSTYAAPLITALADQGITAAKLTEFNTAQHDYVLNMVPLRQAKDLQTKATEVLKTLFEQNNQILTNHLDPQATVFADLAPDFYHTYTIARRITDPATRTRALTVHVAEAGNNSPMAKVDISISPAGLERKTTELGNIWVQNLAKGEITIRCSKPRYQDKTITEYIVDGETTRVVVLMEKL